MAEAKQGRVNRREFGRRNNRKVTRILHC
jgi:hypothetical protein